MTHLDLFSGIGGFAYAADTVFGNVEHIFVEWDDYCKQVLKKHWPEANIYGDIRQFNPDTLYEGLERVKQKQTQGQRGQPDRNGPHQAQRPFILTGGFPCQPFSAAGLRRGTSDERHLWPEMLRVIQSFQPEWVIAENVRGLTNWNEGVVFEQVCTDLETSGYEVQPFIIPAVAVNAPHRRDRVWFVANSGRQRREQRTESLRPERQEPKPTDTGERGRQRASDSQQPGLQEWATQDGAQLPGTQRESRNTEWQRNWTEVAAEFCSVDDGLPVELDGFKLSKSQHRKEQLKAYGNAIVPQVAMEIMRAINLTRKDDL
jgi:DNA (cytosine-5)-methyltransferase 1